MDYADFEIEIGAPTDGRYPVAVLSSPGGEARAWLELPFEPDALGTRLQALQMALLRSGSRRRRVVSTEELAVQAFGQDLFGAIFHDEILSRFDLSRREARREERGLRIKLRFETAELAALPWEYLFDARQADYLSRSLSTPVVRYIELPHPVDPLLVKLPLRILGVVVSPTDLEPLDVEHERRLVDDGLAELVKAGRLELAWLEEPTWEGLQRALRLDRWHVFHFIGHGAYDRTAQDGMIALADEAGRTRRMSAGQLGALLGDHHPMRLALLNSCEGARGGSADIFSSTAATIVRRGTPAVVAMQYEITDAAAIQFSRSFYAAIADGLPVDAAVSAARMGIWLAEPKSLEWGTPVLYMRARDGTLFKVESDAAADADVAAAPAPGFEPRRPRTTAAPPAGPAPVGEAVTSEAAPASDQTRRTFCTRCGKKLVPGFRYCNACGAEVV